MYILFADIAMDFIDPENSKWTVKAVKTVLAQYHIPNPPSKYKRAEVIAYANQKLSLLSVYPASPLPIPGTPVTPSILSSPVPSLTIFEEEEPPEPDSSDNDEDTVPDSPSAHLARLNRNIDDVLSDNFIEMKSPIDPVTVSSIKEHLKVLKQHQKALKEEAKSEELDLSVVQQNVQKLIDTHKKEIESVTAKLEEERSKNAAPDELSQDAGSVRYALEDASVAAEQIKQLKAELIQKNLELEHFKRGDTKDDKANPDVSERIKQLEITLSQERKSHEEQLKKKDAELKTAQMHRVGTDADFYQLKSDSEETIKDLKQQLKEANARARPTTATAQATGTLLSRFFNLAPTTTTTPVPGESEKIKSLQSELAAARDRIAQLESRSAPVSAIHPPPPVPAPLIQKAKDGVDVLVSFVFLAAALRLVEEV